MLNYVQGVYLYGGILIECRISLGVDSGYLLRRGWFYAIFVQ